MTISLRSVLHYLIILYHISTVVVIHYLSSKLLFYALNIGSRTIIQSAYYAAMLSISIKLYPVAIF